MQLNQLRASTRGRELLDTKLHPGTNARVESALRGGSSHYECESSIDGRLFLRLSFVFVSRRSNGFEILSDRLAKAEREYFGFQRRFSQGFVLVNILLELVDGFLFLFQTRFRFDIDAAFRRIISHASHAVKKAFAWAQHSLYCAESQSTRPDFTSPSSPLDQRNRSVRRRLSSYAIEARAAIISCSFLRPSSVKYAFAELTLMGATKN